MSCKIALFVLLVITAAGPVTAQQALSEDAAAEQDAFTVAARNYQDEIDLRSRFSEAELIAHYQSVQDALAPFDGRIVVEGYVDGKWMVVIWNVGVGNVDAYQDDELVPLTPGTDDLGRPTFEGPDSEGWLDVDSEGVLHMQIQRGHDDLAWYWGEYPLDEAHTGPVPLPLIATKLICSCNATGWIGGCNMDSDCRDRQPCTLENGTQSKCKWGTALRRDGSCFGAGLDGLAMVSAMGLATFFGPVRRTVMRRVRRSR